MRSTPDPTARPRSATSPWITLASATALAGTVLTGYRLQLGPLSLLFAGVAALVVVQATLDLTILKVHRNPTSGLIFEAARFRRNLSFGRSAFKLAGLYLTLAAMAPFYLLIPMYSGEFHRPFWELLGLIWPYLVVCSIPYFILVDALMAEPRDGYWQVARLATLRPREVDLAVLREHVKGWAIKGFFLPLMVPLLLEAFETLIGFPRSFPFVGFVYLVAAVALFLDLTFVVLGYASTLRILDSHIRSTNPYLYGWVACLVLYQPFWGFVRLNYADEVFWFHWFGHSTPLLVAWGLLVILSKVGWAWSNVMFGFRFSNLTHRGIITSGPFRWTKHPSYVFKNAGWWLLHVPFLSNVGPVAALQASLALLCINVLYFVRARSEEQHLSEDATYVAYARWIDERGLLRWFGRIFPLLAYQPPRPKRSAVPEMEKQE